MLTCEHAGNQIPAKYARLFSSRAAREALESHRGHDIGALQIARQLARRFQAPLLATSISRLLVDQNRSLGHARHFSEFSAPLDLAERGAVLGQYYLPHRARVERELAVRLSRGVFHLAVHSFTPELSGQVRRADIGLLYDPASALEAELCERWKRALHRVAPDLVVRRNYPYLGKADGLCTYFRRRFGRGSYLGVELEMNQRSLSGSSDERRRLARAIGDSLGELLASGAR